MQLDPFETAKTDPDIARRIREAEQQAREELAAVIARQQHNHHRPIPQPDDVPLRPSARPNYSVTHGQGGPYAKPDSGAHGAAPSDAPAPAEDASWDAAPPAKPSKGGKHPGGRPRRVAPWFEDVAYAMRDGTPVRVALVRCGIHLTKREIRSLYRLKAFKVLYQRARREYLKKWGWKRARGDIRKYMRGPHA